MGALIEADAYLTFWLFLEVSGRCLFARVRACRAVLCVGCREWTRASGQGMVDSPARLVLVRAGGVWTTAVRREARDLGETLVGLRPGSSRSRHDVTKRLEIILLVRPSACDSNLRVRQCCLGCF